jgi:isoquinoline 1-oxidoreductase beta subunit
MSAVDLPAGLSRRHFLAVSLAVGGGMLVGFPFGSRAQAAAAAPTPSAFIRIDRGGRVTLILPYVEMGQGAYTSQAQILAEELEVPLDSVVLEAAYEVHGRRCVERPRPHASCSWRRRPSDGM